MEKLSSKKIATIVVVIVALILIFSVTRMKSTNKVDNSQVTAQALVSFNGLDDPALLSNLISKTLRFGNRGDDVEILQSFLTDNGYELGRVDGIFGLRTRAALKSFQQDNGQRATGVLEPKTKDFINQMIVDEITNSNIDGELDDMGEGNTEDKSGLNLPDDVKKQQKEEEDRRKAEDEKQKEEVKRQDAEKKAEELKKQQEEKVDLLTLKENNTLFKDYACEAEKTDQKLTIYTGETIDESKDKKAVFSLSDVWSTFDGVNWKKEANNTNMGSGWERMVAKDKNGVVYSFGGKYKVVDNKTVSDNGVYKSTNMVDWAYVSDIPEMDHRYDRSVVYFKDTFWLISSMEGIWSSPTGEKWTKEVTKGPWTGHGNERKYNAWGYYESNSLGGYVIDGKMWYLVYNGTSSTQYNNVIRIYSTTDGKNWDEKGDLVNSKDSQTFNILSNINPSPVLFNGEIYIISSNKDNGKPLVIKTNNGKDFVQVSTNDTKFYNETQYFPNVRNYGSITVFLNKLWHIGGWDLQGNTENNDNTNDIWSSSDGIKWENIKPKGVEFPGPAGRWLSGVAVTDNNGIKAENLQIIRKWNDTGFFTGKDEEKTLLGTWKMTADNDKTNTGDIVISYLGFVGNDYKNYKNVQFSSLESLQKITVLADGVEVGSVSSFKGPFYDSTGSYVLPQRITFNKDVTIKAGESVTFTLIADFPVPKYKNFEMRTWLSEIGFKEGYRTPCSVYTEFYFDGYNKFPGKLIGWK